MAENKTAMQTLIDWLDSEDCLLDAYSISHIKEQIEPNLLATERQQLSKAFDEGADRIIPIEGNQYYEQTFGNSQNTQH